MLYEVCIAFILSVTYGSRCSQIAEIVRLNYCIYTSVDVHAVCVNNKRTETANTFLWRQHLATSWCNVIPYVVCFLSVCFLPNGHFQIICILLYKTNSTAGLKISLMFACCIVLSDVNMFKDLTLDVDLTALS